MKNNWLEPGLGKHPYDPYLSKYSWKFESNQLERYEAIDFHQESPRYVQLNWWPKPRGKGGPPEIQYPDGLWALLPHNHPTKSSSHAQAIHPRSNAWRQHHRCGTPPRTSNRSWCRSPRGTHVGSSKKQHSIPQICRVRMDINMQVRGWTWITRLVLFWTQPVWQKVHNQNGGCGIRQHPVQQLFQDCLSGTNTSLLNLGVSWGQANYWIIFGHKQYIYICIYIYGNEPKKPKIFWVNE